MNDTATKLLESLGLYARTFVKARAEFIDAGASEEVAASEARNVALMVSVMPESATPQIFGATEVKA